VRHIEYMGAQPGGALPVFLPPRAIWPIIDRPGGPGTIGKYWGRNVEYPHIRAVCLHPFTDWDQCELLFEGESEWRLLSPGAILRPLKGEALRFSVRPRISSPATLLYDAANVRQSPDQFRATPAVALSAWQFDNSGGANNKLFKNVSAVGQPVYKWAGVPLGWNTGAPFETIAAGAWTSKAQIDGAVGPLANSTRAADFSPDGLWSFADYYAAVKILATNPGNAVLPASALIVGCGAGSLVLDSRGNPGDPTNPSTIQFIQSGPFNLNEWARPTQGNSVFLGTLALDVWDDEYPPPWFRPILPPERVLDILSTLNIPINSLDGNGNPTNPIVTMPALNCDEIQVTLACDATSPQNITVALASPRPQEGYDTVGQLLAPKIVLTPGGGGADLRGENVHPYIQLAIGAPAAGTGKVAIGTQLTLRRRHIGA
jgi:hypothetical protein